MLPQIPPLFWIERLLPVRRCIVGFIQELVPEVAEGPVLSFKEIAAAREKQPGRKKKQKGW
jgi:hypothetical protein